MNILLTVLIALGLLGVASAEEKKDQPPPITTQDCVRKKVEQCEWVVEGDYEVYRCTWVDGPCEIFRRQPGLTRLPLSGRQLRR